MDLSASDRSACTYESDFEAVLILKESFTCCGNTASSGTLTKCTETCIVFL